MRYVVTESATTPDTFHVLVSGTNDVPTTEHINPSVHNFADQVMAELSRRIAATGNIWSRAGVYIHPTDQSAKTIYWAGKLYKDILLNDGDSDIVH